MVLQLQTFRVSNVGSLYEEISIGPPLETNSCKNVCFLMSGQSCKGRTSLYTAIKVLLYID